MGGMTNKNDESVRHHKRLVCYYGNVTTNYNQTLELIDFSYFLF